MMNRRLALTLTTALTVLLMSGPTMARSTYLNNFNSTYGTTNSALDACALCHGATKSIRNAYGQDIEAELNAGSAIGAALATVEPFDSDSDGFDNLTEIIALTFPGDANSTPGGGCTDLDNDTYSPDGGSCGPTDCDDNDATINPGAIEDCTDGIDNDCDGAVDAADPDDVNCPPTCTDLDADGYSVDGGSCGPVDCDDGDAAVNPGVAETTCNGIDDDCDPATEDAPDNDGDGWDLCTDCDDNAAFVNPTEIETCTDGIDNDCNGLVDGADPACGGCVATHSRERGPRCSDGIDNDCDGAADSADSDCGGGGGGGGGGGDPVEDEVCDDNIDNDGDGKIDCADKKDCNKDPACQ
jgi:hypothetical protein